MSDDISPSEYYDVVGEGVRRKGELRSSKEFWDEAEKRLREPVERTIKEVDEHLVRIQEAFDRTSEDSYATRNELRADLAQVSQFLTKKEKV